MSRLVWAALLMSLPAAGCGGPARHAVTGTVTFAGRPVEYGAISFQPDASAGPTAPTGYARITDGKYELPADQRPAAGRYAVKVTGFDKSKMKPDPAPGEAVNTPALFPEFTRTVDIPPPGGTLDIDVPADKGR